jgi:hypothetical protein
MDYERLITRALLRLYPDQQERSDARAKLSRYGEEPHHAEPGRVRLGILYLVAQQPNKLDRYLQLADEDYRDLLAAAEYPYSRSRWSLKKQDPKKYRRLQQQERGEYEAWVESLDQQ